MEPLPKIITLRPHISVGFDYHILYWVRQVPTSQHCACEKINIQIPISQVPGDIRNPLPTSMLNSW